MAENTTIQPRRIKAGTSEYGVDELLDLARAHKNAFLNFALEQGKFNKEQLAQLSNIIDDIGNTIATSDNLSYDAMMSKLSDVSGQFGDARDENGEIIPGRENQLVQVLTRKGNIFRKSKYTQEDLHQWGNFFFSKLLQNMKPYQDKSKLSWDRNKYGFGTWLTGQGRNAQRIYNDYDKITDENATEKSVAERTGLLKSDLTNYLAWLQSQKFNYKENDNIWDDEYENRLNQLITNFDNYNVSQLRDELDYLNSGDFREGYLSNQLEWGKSNDDLAKQRKADADAKAEEERLRAEQEKLARDKEYEAKAFKQLKDDFVYTSPLNLENLIIPEGQSFSEAYLGKKTSEGGNNYYYRLDLSPTVWQYELSLLLTKIHNSKLRAGGTDLSTHIDLESGVVLQRAFMDNPSQFFDVGGGWFLINGTINDDGEGILYYPGTGGNTSQVKRVFIGDIPNFNTYDYIREELAKIINNYIRNHPELYPGYDYIYEQDSTYSIPKNEQGGSLKMQYGGNFDFSFEDTDKIFTERGKQNGRTGKQQKAAERPILESDKSRLHEDAGFTANEWARLTYAAMDIASAGAAFAPGVGTIASGVLGVGSTVGNFISDLIDDGVTTGQALTNLGFGLGMDVVGLIPGAGGVGKFSKIAKSLVKLAPKILAGLGTINAAPHVINSITKWKNGETLTSEDYRNIMLGIQIIAQGAGASARGYRNRQASKAAIEPDKVGLKVQTNKGETKKIVFEGETAKKVRQEVETINAHADDASVAKARKRLDATLKQHNIKDVTIVDSNNNGWRQNLRHPMQNVIDGGGKRHIELFDVINPNVYLTRAQRWFANLGQNQLKAQLDPRLAQLQQNAAISRARQKSILESGDTAAKARKAAYDADAGRRSAVEHAIATREANLLAAPGQITTKTAEQGAVAQQIADIQRNRSVQPGQTVSAVRKAKNEIKAVQKDPEYRRISAKITNGQTLSRRELRQYDAFKTRIQNADAVIGPNTLEKLNALNQLLSDITREISRWNNIINTAPTRLANARNYLNRSTRHSIEFSDAFIAGVKPKVLLDKGWWKRGGKIDKASLIKNLNHFKK